MAAYCVSIFGDLLLDKPLDDFPVSNLLIIYFLFFCAHLLFLLKRKIHSSVSQWRSLYLNECGFNIMFNINLLILLAAHSN